MPTEPSTRRKPTTRPRILGVASLTFAVASLVAGSYVVLAIAGLAAGLVALRTEPAGRTMATIGLVVNGLIVIGWAVFAVLLLASDPTGPRP